MTISTMPLAEVKAHLYEVVSRVSGQHERVTVTVHGKPSAVIMSPDDIERLEETIAVLSDRALIRQLTDPEADLAEGRVADLDMLATAMRARATGDERVDVRDRHHCRGETSAFRSAALIDRTRRIRIHCWAAAPESAPSGQATDAAACRSS